MNTKLTHHLLSALLFVAVTSQVHAQLPNAWQIDDHSTTAGSLLSYYADLSASEFNAATNSGWQFTVTCRMVNSYDSAEGAMYLLFGDGTHRYGFNLNLDSVGQLVVTPLVGSPIVLTTDSDADAGSATNYHTHELDFDPATQQVTYTFDGMELANWSAQNISANQGQPDWGSSSSADQGEMNFHRVEFRVNGQGSVAMYDAGFAGNPANAPNPMSQGWTRVAGSTPISETPISPDSIPLQPLLTRQVSSAADNGPGTLRSAVAFANTNAGGVLITFAPALSGQTIVLTNGQLALSNWVSIDASSLPDGIAISGNRNSRVFYAVGNPAVLDSLILLDGSAPDEDYPFNSGGCIMNGGLLTLNNCSLQNNQATNGTGPVGGGIFNQGLLTMNQCALLGNRVSGQFVASNSVPGDLSGGGIFNAIYGVVTMDNCTLSGNSATNGYGGGGIFNYGQLTMSHCALSNNAAPASTLGGGGILNYTSLTMDHCTFFNNAAPDSDFGGGAVFNDGLLTMDCCTLASNAAPRSYYRGGGGIFNSINGELTMSRSTVTGNSAIGGGGICNDSFGNMTLNDSTIARNTASGGGGILNLGDLVMGNCTLTGNSTPSGGYGGGIHNYGELALTNTIVAGNTSDNGPNLHSEASSSLNSVNSLTDGKPLLAPLGDYGGPTPTLPPLYHSPAIDAGDDSVTSLLTTDQRGYPRKSGAHVDIGAVEGQHAPADNPPVLINPALAATGDGNRFEFMFTNVADVDFTILASTNVALPLTKWTPLGNAAQHPSGQYQFTDPGVTNFPKRFYRAVSP